MAESITVKEFGEEYECVDFFCADRNVSGVDVLDVTQIRCI